MEGREGGERRKSRDYVGAAFYYIVATVYVCIQYYYSGKAIVSLVTHTRPSFRNCVQGAKQ